MKTIKLTKLTWLLVGTLFSSITVFAQKIPDEDLVVPLPNNSKAQQPADADLVMSLPNSKEQQELIQAIVKYFKDVAEAEKKDSKATPSADDLKALKKNNDFLEKEYSRLQKRIASTEKKSAFGLLKDALATLDGMPKVIPDLPGAYKTMHGLYSQDKDPYSLYIKKLEGLIAGAEEDAKQYAPDPNKVIANAKQQSAKAKQEFENNPAVIAAGGMDKLKNMSEADRQKLISQMKKNPSAFMGNQNDPATAFTQKLMTDPSYKERYEHMSTAQKQEEYAAWMKENGFVDNTSVADQNKKFEADLKESYKVRKKQEFTKEVAAIQEYAKELLNIASAADKRVQEYYKKVEDALVQQYGAAIEALPRIAMGEVGHEKETYPLDQAFKIAMYALQTQKAKAEASAFKLHIAADKGVMQHWDAFMDHWKTDKAIMTELGYSPSAMLAGLYDGAKNRTKDASTLVNEWSGQQEVYNKEVLKRAD